MVKFVGYFRELRHGRADGPSFVHAKGRFNGNVEEVVRYLESAATLATASGILYDKFRDDGPRIGPLAIKTDGEWTWPSDLAYYLKEYAVELPDEFVVKVHRRKGDPPSLSAEDLRRLRGEMLGGT